MFTAAETDREFLNVRRETGAPVWLKTSESQNQSNAGGDQRRAKPIQSFKQISQRKALNKRHRDGRKGTLLGLLGRSVSVGQGDDG